MIRMNFELRTYYVSPVLMFMHEKSVDEKMMELATEHKFPIQI